MATHQVALVTNGLFGIGLAVSLALHDVGSIVAVGDSGRRTDATVPPWVSSVHRGVITDPDDCERVVREVVERHGRLDVFVHVAPQSGLSSEYSLERVLPTDWDVAIARHLSGPFFLMRSALEHMLARRHGRIISVLSPSGGSGTTGQSVSGIASSAMVTLTARLAREVADRGVTVNAVTPGLVEPDWLPDEVRDEALRLVPAGRLGTTDDVANVVRFLASPASGYVTGQVIAADGGLRA